MEQPYQPPYYYPRRCFFRPGQLVRIKPGGLPMIVTAVLSESRVLVRWNSEGRAYVGVFESRRLEYCR